jgi:hypothetical protein
MRRARLSVRPNLGPKIVARGSSNSGAEKKTDINAAPQKSVEKQTEKPTFKSTPTKKIENQSAKAVETTKATKNDVTASSTCEVTPSPADKPSPDKPTPVQNGPSTGKKGESQEKVSVADMKQKNADTEVKKMDEPAVPRRSRFPKARPNLSEAGRPRTR